MDSKPLDTQQIFINIEIDMTKLNFVNQINQMQ